MITRILVACLPIEVKRETSPSGRSRASLLACACLAVLIAVALTATVASAAYVQILPPFPESPLPFSIGVTVDNSGGASAEDVFAVGYSGNLVEKFDKEGKPVNFTESGEPTIGGLSGPVGLGVSPSGDLFVANEAGGNIEVFDDTTGAPVSFPAGSFMHGTGYAPFGIAFDTSTNPADPSKGDVYISDHIAKVVNKFKPNGEYISSIGGAELSAPQPDNVAVDREGEVYVNNRFGGVFKYSPTGALIGEFATGEIQALTIDPSTGELFMKEGGEGGAFVQEYDESGSKLGVFGPSVPSSGYAMAVSSASHAVYISDANSGQIHLFASGETPKEAPNTGAVEVSGTTAKFHGELNPGGEVGELHYHFAYAKGLSCQNGEETANEPIAKAKEAKVQGEAKGLAPKTEYSFCLVATNLFGPTFGNPVAFKTEAGPPVIETQSASEVTFDTAKVSATINPSGAPTTCVVKYGLAPGEKEVPCSAALGEGTAGVATSVTLSGLEASKEYHYQFIAENPVSAGTPSEGPDQTFTTEALTIPTTETPTEIGPETAKANGRIKPNVATNYYFAYGPAGGELKQHTPEHELLAGAETSVSDTLSGLTPRTSYEVQLVTVTVADKVEIKSTAVVAFATKVALPTITNAPPSITRTTATLSGEVNTQEGASEYAIQYGTTTAYTSGTTPSVQLEGAVGPTAIEHVLLSELKAGTTYHYRIIATNESGTTNGPDATFTTGKPQPPFAFTGEANSITGTSATIIAGVNPDGLQTSYVWEVGSEAEPGVISYTPTYGTAGSGSGGVGLSLGLTGLQPGSTYHYRITAHNEDGTATGADQTFTTSGFTASIIAPAPVTLIPYTAPVEPPAGKGVTVKSLTRAQKLTKALKQCSKQPKHKRAACVKNARKHYGPVKKKATKRGGKR